jgi:hypothetical protein
MANSDHGRSAKSPPTAGEKFVAWIKSFKEKLCGRCLKKFIIDETPVKSGENSFPCSVIFNWHRRC